MHAHAQSSGHAPSDDAASGFRTAFFLNLAFTVIEIAGGIWTNSVAVISDAVHDTGDCLSVGTAWYLEHLSKAKPNRMFTYGYRRVSVLGGLITGVVLLIGVAVVVWRSVERLMAPEHVNAKGMIVLGVLGILANGSAVLRLRKSDGLNARMVGWHFLEDTLGWVAILLGSIALLIWHVPIIDPILSISISLFVLFNVGRNVRRVVLVFLQTAPPGFEVDAFVQGVRRLAPVVSLHHLHSWSIDGNKHVFSMHVVLRRDTSAGEVLELKSQIVGMLAPHGFEHITIETERVGDTCVTGRGSPAPEPDEPR